MLSDLTTNQKGAIAETAIVKEATRLGIEVYRPVAEGDRFDLIFLMRKFGERRAVQLTLKPSRNNRRAKVHWAAAYEFAATIGRAIGAGP